MAGLLQIMRVMLRMFFLPNTFMQVFFLSEMAKKPVNILLWTKV